jgi:hypothetical protein
MAGYITAHFHNTPPRKAAALSEYIRGPHAEALNHVRSYRGMQRFEVTKPQLTPEPAQPWRYVTIYDLDIEDPAIDVPALSPLIADMRDAGLIAQDDAERIYTYKMYSPWKFSKNYKKGPFSHMMLLLANQTPGRSEEYHKWYDDVHSVEVGEAVGYVGMRRGGLSPVQCAPERYCPGSELIMGSLQCDDLEFTIKDFIDRAYGRSPSGVAWSDRSTAASVARTVHMFESVDGPFEGPKMKRKRAKAA